MKKWLCLCACVWGLCGCTQNKSIINDNSTISSFKLPQDYYYMADDTLQTIQKSSYEETDVVYYVKDELALTKVILYQVEQGNQTVAYQSEKPMDIDQTSEYLSLVLPFDLSLTQNVTAYTNAKDEVLYESYHITLAILDTRYDQSTAFVKKVIQNILGENMNTNDKIQAIHDYIVDHCQYDKNAQGKDVFQAAGVFLDKKAVCTGYSRAFMMLAKEAGIPAVYVPSEQMNHGWNYVFDGDNWRYIDVTWDDQDGQGNPINKHMFLNMSEAEFLKEGSHTFSKEEQKLVFEVAQAYF